MAKIGNQGDGGGVDPIVFSKEQVIEVEALAAVLSKAQLANYFCIAESTFRAIEKRQPEVDMAYRRGRSNQIANMGKNLVELAQTGNVTANIFYLKTQGGWRETDNDVSSQPINISIVNPSE
jgi:hypothetical protein|tara:strand:- start:179 stop:544 length:366 start_codon:yes stop_codon:yes gene_type:complete